MSFGLEPTIDYVGPMARTVEEVAAALQCAGRVRRPRPAPGARAREPAPYSDALSRGVPGLRVGVLDEGFGMRAVTRRWTRRSARRFTPSSARARGVERVSVPLHAKALLGLLPIYLEGGKRMYDTHFGGSFAKSYYP